MKPVAIIGKIVQTKPAMIVRKYSPEILTGLGIVSGIGATIAACRATMKVSDVVDERNEKMHNIRQQLETTDEESYSEKHAQHDRVKAQAEMVLDVAKLYSPAVGLTVLSVTSTLGAYGIAKKRIVALGAAYAAVSTKFKEYRGRVIDEFGKNKDRELLHGIRKEKVSIKEKDENGKTKTVKKEIEVIDPDKSVYARFFDDASRNWVNDPEINLAFLSAQQNMFNDLLKARGHVFLNEVYDALDIPRTKEGAIVGWVFDPSDPARDNYIDFDIYCIENQEARDFVNGYNPIILLDFNVDGIIYDLI